MCHLNPVYMVTNSKIYVYVYVYIVSNLNLVCMLANNKISMFFKLSYKDKSSLSIR